MTQIKRSDQRRRRNKPEVEIEHAPSGAELDWGKPAPEWTERATRWYESLALSGQAIYYQRTDVEQARFIADLMTIVDGQGLRVNAQLVSVIMSGMADLLCSERPRRMARIELARQEQQEAAPVLEIVDRRNQLAASD